MSRGILTFDCYGTLVDWETGLLRVLRPWAHRRAVAARDDELLEAFAAAESYAETRLPGLKYSNLLGVVQEMIATSFGVESSAADRAELAGSVGLWPVFDDSRAALAELQRDYRLIVVSNVDRDSFDSSQESLGIRFDGVVTAEDVGVYKPDPLMFERTLEVVGSFGYGAGDVLHVAQSLYHDHVPAKRLGLRTAWVNRRGGQGWGATKPPEQPVEPDIEVPNLTELVNALKE